MVRIGLIIWIIKDFSIQFHFNKNNFGDNIFQIQDAYFIFNEALIFQEIYLKKKKISLILQYGWTLEHLIFEKYKHFRVVR